MTVVESSGLVHALFVMNHWLKWSQYEAYGVPSVFLLRVYGEQLAQLFVNLTQKFLRKYKENNKIILDLARSLFKISSIMFKLAHEQKP